MTINAPNKEVGRHLYIGKLMHYLSVEQRKEGLGFFWMTFCRTFLFVDGGERAELTKPTNKNQI
jgi:hypothetical protein